MIGGLVSGSSIKRKQPIRLSSAKLTGSSMETVLSSVRLNYGILLIVISSLIIFISRLCKRFFRAGKSLFAKSSSGTTPQLNFLAAYTSRRISARRNRELSLCTSGTVGNG